MVSEFIADISADLGGLAEVKNFNLIFEDYKLVLFSEPPIKLEGYTNPEPPRKVWYLKAEGRPKNASEVTFSKPDLLFSLLNLGSKIEKNALRDELALSEEVIEWCKKYGFPYEERYFTENYSDEEQEKKIGKNIITGYAGFRLGEFKRRVAVLYGLFNLWYGLTYDELKRVIEFSPLVLGFDTQKDINEQLLQMKDFLSRRIWLEMDISHLSLALQYNKETDKYNIGPYTNNLIAVAYFQLAMMMTKAGEGNRIKFCSKCGEVFEANHGNKKMCSKCDRVYHRDYMREKRKRNKPGYLI